jgi:hypothetical protein
MDYATIATNDNCNSMATLKKHVGQKKPGTKGYIPCDSTYMAF